MNGTTVTRRLAQITVGAVFLATAQLASVAEAEELPPDPTVSQAADNYTGTASSAAALAEAASPTESVAVAPTADGFVATGDNATRVDVAPDGQTTISAPGAPELGLSVKGADDTQAVSSGGAVVQTDALPSTDIVTRATDSGAQIVAVMNDAAAPNTLAFPMQLPAGAELVKQDNGTVEVQAPVKIETVPSAEVERVSTAVDAVLGGKSDDAPITEAEQAQLDAIPVAKVVTQTRTETVATVAPAWAVDANGNQLSTHYEVQGDTIKQVVETDANTAFPVTADPNWVWWTLTSAACVAEVAGFLFVGYKLARTISKVDAVIKDSRYLSAIISKLGGAKRFFEVLIDAAKGIAKGSVRRYLSSTQVSLLSDLARKGLTTIGNVIGVGSCVSLIQEAL